MKTFLKNIGLFLLSLGLILPFWDYIIRHSKWDNIGILNFQVEKIKAHKGRHFSIIYIGDSSGGYALSSSEDSSEINLCLTGSFGFEGQIPFLSIVDEYISYDTIVLMHTIDMPTRDLSSDAGWIPNIHSKNFLLKTLALIRAMAYSTAIVESYFESRNMETDLSIDYPRSNSKTPYQDNDHFKKKIKAEKLEELKTLSEKLAMNAEYMVFFGPSLPYDEEYLERLNAELRKLKIKHALNIPYALTHVNKGNSEDHVHPGFSSECSRYYLELLRHSEINGEIIKASKP